MALAAARHLGLSPEPPADEHLIAGHVWPGRFEEASADPVVILDGAHNPQAAQGLASSLGARHDRWTLIVGVGAGHDAQGLIEALAPVAKRIILNIQAKINKATIELPKPEEFRNRFTAPKATSVKGSTVPCTAVPCFTT